MSQHGSKPRLRLVKVIVHPILVLDDGENLTEFANVPSEVSAADWADFPERLRQDIADVEEHLAQARDGE